MVSKVEQISIEFSVQIKTLSDRISDLENQINRSGSQAKADSSILSLVFANLPASARIGEQRFVVDRSIGAQSGVLVVWNGTVWVNIANGTQLV